MVAQAPAEVMAGVLQLMDERHGGFVPLLVRHGLDPDIVGPFRALMLVAAD